MRHSFDRLNLNKNDLVEYFKKETKEEFVPIEKAHKILASFLKDKNIKINDLDSWVLFTNFDKTYDHNYSVQNMAKWI